MEEDRRKQKRIPIRQLCWIVTDSNSNPQECNLDEISAQGARLTCDLPDPLPDKMILLFTKNGKSARRCKVLRRSDKELALEFIEKITWHPPELVSLDI